MKGPGLQDFYWNGGNTHASESHGIARPTAEGAVSSRYLLDSSSMERSQIYGNQTIKVRAVLGLNMFTVSLLVSLRNCLQKFSNDIVNNYVTLIDDSGKPSVVSVLTSK